MPTEATPIATRSAAAVGDRGAIVAVFNALSDPTRLAVVERLSIGPASATELSRPFDMGLPAFMQHLGVLADAGIVTSHKAGRTRTFQLAPEALQLAATWLSTFRNHWERRLDQLHELLLHGSTHETPSSPPKTEQS